MISKLKEHVWISDKHKRRVSITGGLLLSFAIVVGAFLHYQNRLARNFPEFLLHLLIILLVSLVTIPLTSLLLVGIEKVSIWYKEKQVNRILKYKNKTVLIVSWALIFLCWMPMFLTNWPSNFIFDAKYQIQEVLTNGYHTHHPLVHTYLLGFFYRLGMDMGNASLGLSFYTLLQMLTLSFVMGLTITYLYQKKVPKVLLIIFVAFYALIPVNAIFSITATKDVFFAALFLLYSIYVCRWIYDNEDFGILQWIGFVLTGICMCLFRNNAVFALVAIMPFFLIFKKGKGNKIKYILSIVAILLGFMLTTFLVGKALHSYNNDAMKESLSVPLQQLARVANYRVDDLDPDLYQEITTFIPVENIESYSPYISDAVKIGADENMLQDHMGEFLSLWARVLVRFPGEYVASFMSNTMGFWYPGPTAYEIAEEISLFHTSIGMGEEIVKQDYLPWIGGINHYLYGEMNYKHVPVLNLFFKSFFYVWMMLLVIFNSIYAKKKRNILPMGLMITYILTLFLGPIVTLRYMYCVIVSLPILIFLLLDSKYVEKFNVKNSKDA
jgi:hypothetical protein